MIDLKDIQTTISGYIAAADYFAGKTVIVDDGSKFNEREAAVRDNGFCVSVDMPIDTQSLEEAPGDSVIWVMIPVYVEINPDKNAQLETPLNILEAITELFAAVLTPGTSSDKIMPMPKPFELVTNDPGLLAYVCWFKAMTAIP